MTLRPIVDLDSGAVLAVEALLPSEEQRGEDVSALSERLGRLAREVVSRESLLPLVLPVPARLLTAGREPFAHLEDTLRRTGRRPRDITLMVGAELRELPHPHLLRGVGHIREMGFRYALGTARVAPDVLVETAPFLFRVDGTLTSGLPGNERFTAIVEGMARIGRGAGSFPLASGVTSVPQLASLRRAGVRLAQGPLFAGDDWAPGERVAPVPDLSLDSTSPGLDPGPRVSEFMLPAVTMTGEATSEEVLEAFSNDSALNSVILIDHRERPVAAVDRARFLLAITGPYGHALHARRPAQRLADSPRTVPRSAPALTALRAAGTERERVYDDLIATNEFGQCMGVVHVGDLIRSLSRE
ncbi:EAL domain-containing protein [Actinorugispora endophytica]|uniref:EAL domain-containing protein (Putative c-di-GMP-specific phosphodiesterase class I) n=1 Tax=Actinorugispora endophytica TaxID=1605990 RepID=A0A4V3D6Z7_9ACTN|nr:EAL domain-containing protein [Actinorugispora endophytica]TDQ45957.1 EAL domain-containing protein (putative c-di-GMP-specific phosphodiesterase class I) [Actinorugispora endophytica]